MGRLTPPLERPPPRAPSDAREGRWSAWEREGRIATAGSSYAGGGGRDADGEVWSDAEASGEWEGEERWDAGAITSEGAAPWPDEEVSVNEGGLDGRAEPAGASREEGSPPRGGSTPPAPDTPPAPLPVLRLAEPAGPSGAAPSRAPSDVAEVSAVGRYERSRSAGGGLRQAEAHQVGTRVLAQFGTEGDEFWWPGIVLEVRVTIPSPHHDDHRHHRHVVHQVLRRCSNLNLNLDQVHEGGLYDVAYDDGDVELRKPRERVLAASSAAAKNVRRCPKSMGHERRRKRKADAPAAAERSTQPAAGDAGSDERVVAAVRTAMAAAWTAIGKFVDADGRALTSPAPPGR